jgi:hypothetical protein
MRGGERLKRFNYLVAGERQAGRLGKVWSGLRGAASVFCVATPVTGSASAASFRGVGSFTIVPPFQELPNDLPLSRERRP